MKVAEKFTSINGEGMRAGEIAVFVRFKGCNLRCSYCDTLWANEPECPYKEETPEEIIRFEWEGFQFNKEISDTERYIFTRAR